MNGLARAALICELAREDLALEAAAAADADHTFFAGLRKRVQLHHWRIRLDFYGCHYRGFDVDTIVQAMRTREALTRRGLQQMAYIVVGSILSIYVQVGYPNRNKRFNTDYDPTSAATRVFNVRCGGSIYKPTVTPFQLVDPWIPPKARYVLGSKRANDDAEPERVLRPRTS